MSCLTPDPLGGYRPFSEHRGLLSLPRNHCPWVWWVFPLGKCREMGSLGHTKVLLLIFGGISSLCPAAATRVGSPPQYATAPSSPRPHGRLPSLGFSVMSVLTGERRRLIFFLFAFFSRTRGPSVCLLWRKSSSVSLPIFLPKSFVCLFVTEL